MPKWPEWPHTESHENVGFRKLLRFRSIIEKSTMSGATKDLDDDGQHQADADGNKNIPICPVQPQTGLGLPDACIIRSFIVISSLF
jgi:hypothetical protein